MLHRDYVGTVAGLSSAGSLSVRRELIPARLLQPGLAEVNGVRHRSPSPAETQFGNQG